MNQNEEKMILDNLPLVAIVVQKNNFQVSGFSYDDFIQIGRIGLIRAAKKYDKSKNFKFSTYAYIRIRGEILDEIRNFQLIPRSSFQKIKKIIGAREEYLKKNKKEPTTEILMKITSSERVMVKFALKFDFEKLGISFYQDFNDERQFLNLNKFSIEEELENFITKSIRKKIRDICNEKEKEIIKMRFYENSSLDKIATHFKTSQTTIGFVIQNILFKLAFILKEFK